MAKLTLTWNDVVAQTGESTVELSDFVGHVVTFTNFADKSRTQKGRNGNPDKSFVEMFADATNETLEGRVQIPETYAKKLRDTVEAMDATLSDLELRASVEKGTSAKAKVMLKPLA